MEPGREHRPPNRAAEHGSAHPHPPELSPSDEKKAEEEKSLSAKVTYETIRREGEEELQRTPSALAWSGLAAGLGMGFSLAAEGLLRSHLPDAPWRPLVTKLGYSVGFLIVILGSQQLFTENTLTPVVPLLLRRTGEVLAKVARLWAVVLVANLIGVFLFTLVIAKTELFRPEVRQAFAEIGREAFEGGFWTIFVRGVFAGWLIALLVWMLPAAQTAHVAVIVIMTYLVALAGLAHIIAGSADTLYLVLTGEASFLDYLSRFMIPTLLGNVLGGLTLVTALNHAQVVGGGGKEKA